MKIKKEIWLLIGFFVLLTICGLVTDGFGFFVDNTEDFIFEQQPGADSVGELLGKQYSQLRGYSASLDDLACKVEINEAAQVELREIYGEGEAEWPEDARAEARNYRLEHSTLLQRYSSVSAEFNVLRTDIRTLVDELGLEVQEIPKAEEMSPVDGMCGNFALPEEITTE